jgi:phage-related protein
MPKWVYPSARPRRRELFWVGTTLEDLRTFPEEVRLEMGYALHLAQLGEKSPDAKPLRGFQGAGVLEVVENHDGNTFRAVYTVRLESGVYALHAFQKKSHKGIATDQRDLELIKKRLSDAVQIDRAAQGKPRVKSR